MTARIRANRPEVTDRFPMLGLTIRTDGPPQRAEVAIAVDPGLFRPERKADRKPANFYSSRAGGPISVPRGEAVYIVPPEVLARFIGQDRLYVALATTPESTGAAIHVDVLPGEGSPYVSLKNLTGRSMKRVRLLPSRQQRAAGYGADGQKALEWAGDAAVPGMQQAPNAAAAAPTTPAAARRGNGQDTGAPSTAPVMYDDGFTPPLPPPPSDKANPPVAAQSYDGRAAYPPAQEDLSADAYGIDGPIPDAEPTAIQAARAMDAPQPEYPRASRFAPAHPSNYHVAGKPRSIDRVVIHITDGGSKIAGTIGWFQNPNQRNSRNQPIHVSAHYVVGQDGEVVQMVRNNDIAHHASQANTRSIGIEHVANSKGLMPSEAEYQASAALVAWLCAQLGIPADREHIVGHHAISPRDQHDDCPDSVWDWDHYMDLVQTAATSVGAQALWEGEPPKEQDWATSAQKFGWPAGLGEGNSLVRAFIEAANERAEHNVRGEPAPDPTQFVSFDPDAPARREALKNYIPQLGAALQSRDVSEAILQVTTAVSMQVFDQIKDRLPESLQAPIALNPADLPRPSPDFTVPRGLPYLSRRIGTFMAWVDIAIQQATADTAERLRLQKEQWDMMGGMVGGGFTILGMVPGAGTAATFIGLAVQAIITAATPDFDRQYASFAAAMKAVRRTYKGLAAAVLKGLIAHKMGQELEVIGIPLHPDVQSYLDAHTAYALKGWEEELAFLGFAEAGAEPAFSQARALTASRPPARPALGRQWATAQGMFDVLPVDLKLRVFIPSPAILMERPVISNRAFGGDGRGFQFEGGTSRAEIQARLHFGNDTGGPKLTDVRRAWGESTEYKPEDTEDVPGKPSWYRNKRPGATPIDRDTLGVTDSNLTVQLGGSSVDGMISMAEGSLVVTFHVAGSLPLVTGSPDIDANLAVHVKVDGDRVKARVHGGHDEFPAYEAYANGILIYSYNPLDHGGTPLGLVGTGDFDVEPDTDYVDVGPATEFRVIGPVRINEPAAQSLGRVRALGDDSFTLNWDDLELVAQPTGVSCWSAAAAMMIGWRDRVSITPESIAEIAGRGLDQGMNREYANVKAFAEMMGLAWEEPQSYSVDGFRRLLENYGPLWVTKEMAGDIPNLHAVIVTGLYSDGTNTFVRVTDPWDREVGTPGTPGSYLDTHATGSRYIMSWDQFMAEYEWLRYRDNRRPKNKQRDFLHILHAEGTDGRVPNYGPGTPAGYAQSLRATRLPPPPKARSFDAPSASPAQPARRRIRGGSANVSWELDQYDGMKAPAGMAVAGAQTPTAGTTINLSDWPYIDAPAGRTYAAVMIDWRHQGGMVGEVKVAVPTSKAQGGYALKVTADIGDGPDTATIAALRITVRHEFSCANEPNQVAVTEVTLFGDGRYQRQNHWEQLAQAAA